MTTLRPAAELSDEENQLMARLAAGSDAPATEIEMEDLLNRALRTANDAVAQGCTPADAMDTGDD